MEPLPPGVGPRRRYEHLIVPDPATTFAPFVADYLLGPEPLPAHLPDFLPRYPFMLVRPRLRALLDELDPGGGYAFPARLLSRATGEPVPGEWLHWVPRRWLSFDFQGSDPDLRLDWQVPGLTRKHAWELAHDPALRAHLDGWANWAAVSAPSTPAFTRAAFGRPKAEGITGLVENTADRPADRSPGRTWGMWGEPRPSGAR